MISVPNLDAIILGGGAAGLMCAIEAGRLGRKVAVLERAPSLGKKILISGGGRCNFTNLHCQPANFLSDQSPLRQIGSRSLHSGRFHRAGRKTRHPLP